MSRSTSWRSSGSICALSAAPLAVRLKQLAADWSPLQLTPETYDADEAQEWFEVLAAAMGGPVLKPTAAWSAGGRRSSWAKVNAKVGEDARDSFVRCTVRR